MSERDMNRLWRWSNLRDLATLDIKSRKIFQIPSGISVRLSSRSLFLSIDSNTEGLVLLSHNIYLENTHPVVFLLHLLDTLELPAWKKLMKSEALKSVETTSNMGISKKGQTTQLGR